MSPLEELLCQERDPLGGVALCWDSGANSDRSASWGEFVVDVARLRDHLVDAPAGGWVLLTEDAYRFAVGLFALWHSGRHAISPPNRQAGAIQSPQTQASGVLTDRPDWFSDTATLHPIRSADPRPGDRGEDLGEEFRVAAKSFRPLDPGALGVEFYTSGTTGDEKPVLKEIGHLGREVSELARNWDALVGGSVLFSSASHQHVYGMLFGVLWPLCSAHVFQSQHFLHAGELVPRLCAARRSVLASVPTHLKRLAWHAQSPALEGHCTQVFSSGGPLAEETAHRVASLVGSAPIEIYGSTETGGVAWRRQTSRTDPPLAPPNPAAGGDKGDLDDSTPDWTPFGGVEIEEDQVSGTLRVRSPFVSQGTPDRDKTIDRDKTAGADEFHSFTTGDRIALKEDGRFELLGRVDRVVKIGERRLDLTLMESELRGERWVEEIALTTLQREVEEESTSAGGKRIDAQERVAGVVVPSDAGWKLIRSSGRRALSTELRNRLANGWDPILHPRYWRFVTALPENAQGKTSQPLLRALFQEADWGSLGVDRPEMLGESRSADAIERTGLVPSDLSCFPGHFPDRFVVPGVLQLDWGLGLAEAWLGYVPKVTEIESLKLLLPLEPGARFRIRVRKTSENRLEIKLWFENEVFARARLRIADPNS